MKAKLFAIGLILVVLVACVKAPEPSVPVPIEGPTQELAVIDSLMWHHPDSALAVMMEFAGSEAADGMDAFEGHYCQVLVAELLYKNDYGQSNREEVLKAVGYFDSIDDGFLAARAHYINGVGFYERDSVVAACGEEAVKYVGITKRNPEIRWAEHLASNTKRNTLRYELVQEATGLTKNQARILEQQYINLYGLEKNGGQLLNQINSIAPSRWNSFNIRIDVIQVPKLP